MTSAGELARDETKPLWPPGFWRRFTALPKLPDDFELPEPLPPSPHRDAVIDEFAEWLNAEAEKEKPA